MAAHDRPRREWLSTEAERLGARVAKAWYAAGGAFPPLSAVIATRARPLLSRIESVSVDAGLHSAIWAVESALDAPGATLDTLRAQLSTVRALRRRAWPIPMMNLEPALAALVPPTATPAERRAIEEQLASIFVAGYRAGFLRSIRTRT